MNSSQPQRDISNMAKYNLPDYDASHLS